MTYSCWYWTYENQVAKKIESGKSNIKKIYYEPRGTIKDKKLQKWAVVQVIKAVLGIPIVPGK